MHVRILFSLTYLFIFIFSHMHGLNISFQTSSLHLPSPLFHHISATYQNSLHILVGNTDTAPYASYMAYSTPSFNISQFINRSDTLSFIIDPSNYPDYWVAPTLEPTEDPTVTNTGPAIYEPEIGNPQSSSNCDFTAIDFSNYAISCDHKCSQSIDHNLYIAQSISWLDHDSCIDLYLIIYDMDTQQFVHSSTYDFNHIASADQVLHLNRYPYEIICVYSYSDTLVIAGSDTSSSIKYYVYNPSTDSWSNGHTSRSFSLFREAGGCVEYNGTMYLFCGIMTGYLVAPLETRYVEYCDANPSSGSCSYLTAKMAHRRSNVHVTLILDQYFFIYGGTTTTSQQSIEVFDPSTEEFITEITYNTQSLNMYGFAASILNDYLIISGGTDGNGTVSTRIQYVNIAELFPTKEVEMDEDVRYCTTTYNIPTDCMDLDDYLIDGADTYIFDVHTTPLQTFLWLIDPANTPESFNLNFNEQMGFDGNVSSLFVTPLITPIGQQAPGMYMLDISQDSIQNTCDPEDHYYAFWLRYTPYLQWGFGDTFGE
eukprot:955878_1